MSIAAPATAHAEGLSAAELAAFRRDGFVHLRGVIEPAELAALRDGCDRLALPMLERPMPRDDHRYAVDEATGRTVLHRIDDMARKDEAFLRLLGNPRLLAVARAIFGPDFVTGGIAFVLKAPGCGVAVPWHRDPAFCRVEHGINLGVYLDDADAENGMLHAVPGSHGGEPADVAALVERHGFDLPGAIPVPTRAGDVIVHSENVLHGSRLVRSTRQRRVLYVGVRAIREQLDRGDTPAQLRAWWRLVARGIRLRAERPEFAHEPRYDLALSDPAWMGEEPPGTLGGMDLPIATSLH